MTNDTISVAQALAGRRVLITGCTGFVAKAVLEKLVREVPGIAQLVVLLRGNRQHPNAQTRFHAEVLSSSVFDHLRRTDPERLAQAVQRMRFVTGEITEPGLGLASAEFDELARGIDVIVNVAASVNFREELDQALAINTLAVQHLTQLAQRAGGVPLVQVSTCYVHGLHRGRIRERLAAPARMELERHAGGHHEVDGLMARLQSRIQKLKQRTPEPVARSRALVELGIEESQSRGWNDTYTFTKWLGEQIAWREMAGGTLTIVRPAIVESAWREPQRGWIEGMKVGDAIVLAYARGKTTLFPARLQGIADIVPVDLVANAIVLATAQALARPGQRRIVQVASSVRNPIRVGEYIERCQTEMRDNQAAYPRLIRRPITKPFRTVPRSIFIAYLALAHNAARLANQATRLLGARENLALFEKLETTRQLAVTFSFYTAPRYVFECTRLLAMAAEFDPADRQRFEVDPRCVDWATYVSQVHLPGLERFAIKDRAASAAPAVAQPAAQPANVC